MCPDIGGGIFWGLTYGERIELLRLQCGLRANSTKTNRAYGPVSGTGAELANASTRIDLPDIHHAVTIHNRKPVLRVDHDARMVRHDAYAVSNL